MKIMIDLNTMTEIENTNSVQDKIKELLTGKFIRQYNWPEEGINGRWISCDTESKEIIAYGPPERISSSFFIMEIGLFVIGILCGVVADHLVLLIAHLINF